MYYFEKYIVMSTTIIVLEDDQITGFSYSFAKALLSKLLELHAKEILYQEEDKESILRKMIPTPLVKNLCHYLKQQIPHTSWDVVLEKGIAYKKDVDKDIIHWQEKIKKDISDVLQTAQDFLSTFEEQTEAGVHQLASGVDLQQDLREFLLNNFDHAPRKGGHAWRAYTCLVSWIGSGRKKTLLQLLQRNNPLKSGNGIRNLGEKSFEHIRSEFERLGIETKNYPFFQ